MVRRITRRRIKIRRMSEMRRGKRPRQLIVGESKVIGKRRFTLVSRTDKKGRTQERRKGSIVTKERLHSKSPAKIIAIGRPVRKPSDAPRTTSRIKKALKGGTRKGRPMRSKRGRIFRSRRKRPIPTRVKQLGELPPKTKRQLNVRRIKARTIKRARIIAQRLLIKRRKKRRIGRPIRKKAINPKKKGKPTRPVRKTKRKSKRKKR